MIYGNKNLLPYELAIGFTRSANGSSATSVPEDIVAVQWKIDAKWKLPRILKYKATFEGHIKVGNMVEGYKKLSLGERGVWSSLKIALLINQDPRSTVVPGKEDKSSNIAIEDVRDVIAEDSFTNYM